MVVLLFIMYLINKDMGKVALFGSLKNFATMLSILPPILLLIGLLDVWIPKETMIKYMGEHSGILGFLIAFFLGSFAAGPLYVAFPIAAILMKKGARFAYIIFFLGVWSSAKLPLLMYELNAMGATFTSIHVIMNLVVFFISALLMERFMHRDTINQVYEQALKMTV